MTFLHYVQKRYASTRIGWECAWFRPLWLEAVCYGIVRHRYLNAIGFNEWCDSVDQALREQHLWKGSLTKDVGRECFLDMWRDDVSPQQAVDTIAEQFSSDVDGFRAVKQLQ